jgi:peroxiredoxin
VTPRRASSADRVARAVDRAPGGRVARTATRWGALAALALTLLPAAPRAEGPTPARAKAPGFSARSVTGERLELAALLARGPVVLDFWATWCKPCLMSLPELERLHRRYAGRGVTVIGVSVDGPRNHAKVRPFAHRLGLGFPVVLDTDERLQALYQVRAVPTTVLIGRDGTLLHHAQGFLPGDTERLEAAVVAALGDSAETEVP